LSLGKADGPYKKTIQRTPLRVSLNAPLAFDASIKQIVQLLFGHTLYLLPEELRLDGALPELAV
jgi:hypothetical protein